MQQSPQSGPARTVSYVWDKVGNRTSVSDTAANGGAAQAYTSNNLNQYKNVAGKVVGNEPAHGLSSYDTVNYEYMGDTYLAKATATGTGNTYTLYYDALGRCVRRERVTSGVTATNYYHFDGEHWLLEYNPDGTAQSSNLYGIGIDEIVARYNGAAPAGSQEQWPYQDRNGNTSVVTGGFNGAATLLEYYRYDAFGQPTIYDPSDDSIRSGGTAIANRFLFTGREWNPEYKFYEYRARAYSPALGRFTSEDPKGFEAGDYNLFRYVSNDPLDRVDPMGLDAGDPFDSPDAAVRDIHGIINPISIKQNVEYGSTVYRLGGKYFVTKPLKGTERESHKRNDIPKDQKAQGANIVGDYHTHGDYSYREPGTENITRTTKSRSVITGKADNMDSDNFSSQDRKVYREQATGKKEYDAYLGNPAGKLLKLQGPDFKDKPEDITRDPVLQKTGN